MSEGFDLVAVWRLPLFPIIDTEKRHDISGFPDSVIPGARGSIK